MGSSGGESGKSTDGDEDDDDDGVDDGNKRVTREGDFGALTELGISIATATGMGVAHGSSTGVGLTFAEDSTTRAGMVPSTTAATTGEELASLNKTRCLSLASPNGSWNGYPTTVTRNSLATLEREERRMLTRLVRILSCRR